MSSIGQTERATQNRVVALFRERLHYDYLGDKTELDNLNIEPELLAAWLKKQKVSDTLIGRALHKLNNAATDTGQHLYDRNKEGAALYRRTGSSVNRSFFRPWDARYFQ
jgi:type I restriction enzyme R subunit